MSDQIYYIDENDSGVTMNFNNPISLRHGVTIKQLENVHIPDTDVTFLRSRGKVSRPITVQGVETFSTLSSAQSFRDQLENMQGMACTISHASLGTHSCYCRAVERGDGIDTNDYPGFHWIFALEFEDYP